MRYLKIDDQTISDLGIFGAPGKPSIYGLYNKTVTQGGGARLEALFRQPLADEAAVNKQAARYAFFSTADRIFPVDAETMSTVAWYLQNEDVRSQLQPGSQSIGQRFKDMVAADAEQVFVQEGVLAVCRLFNAVDAFMRDVERSAAGSAYEPVYKELHAVVLAPVFDPVRLVGGQARLSVVVLSGLDKLIRFTERERMMTLLELLYDLDVYIAVGQVARRKGLQFARALPRASNVLMYRGVYHPHVDSAIPNDLELSSDHNVLFLTGANMAGKSTLMKSVGIALYLAHMGFPVAAKQLEFAVRDGIFTSINLADNLHAGASHYYAEVLRVKEVARELSSGQRLFVIFDELFRGTNVKDAYDATIALTTAFAGQIGSQFIISTHIMEAGEILLEKPLPIGFQFLPTIMEGSRPTYTRVLRDGITADRQGMIIIQNEGILDILDHGLKIKED